MSNDATLRNAGAVALVLAMTAFGPTCLMAQEPAGPLGAAESAGRAVLESRPSADPIAGSLFSALSVPGAGTPRTLQAQIDRIVVARVTLEAVIQALDEAGKADISDATVSDADFREMFEADPDVASILIAIEERQTSIFELESTTVDASKTARYKRISRELERYEEALSAIRDDIRERLARSSGLAAKRDREEAVANFQARAALYRRVEQLLRDRVAEGLSDAEHLRAAAGHLRKAGRSDVADQLASEAEDRASDSGTTQTGQNAGADRAALQSRIEALEKQITRLRESMEKSFQKEQPNSG